MIIIALHGPMGSGKTTISNMIMERCKLIGLEASVLPFAKPLKDFARLLGWDGKKDAKGRRCLQLLGTEVGRKCIDTNLWTSKWKKAITDADASGHDVIICDDLRFLNEYEAIKGLSLVYHVIVVKIKGRGSQVNGFWQKLMWHIRNWLGLLHPSERPMPDYLFDMLIDNRGSMSDLESKLEVLYHRMQA